MPTWTTERVLGLAPDASSAAAARWFASAAGWSDTGAAPGTGAVWGQVAGSAGQPYRTAVDLDGPAYSCTCPSRKIPCKHSLGLLLRWADGNVADAPVPDWVAEWLSSREQRAARAAAKAAAAPPPDRPRAADPAAAQARAAKRSARVAAGLDELDRWLLDQVRTGVAGAERAGYAYSEPMAARMVDAQAPGVAGMLRRLPGVVASGEGWHARLLDELAALRLLVVAHRRLAELPDGLAATVRSLVGYPVATEDVLATAPVADEWQVLGRRDSVEDRLITRRVWLRGTSTGRMALVLSFAVSGGSLDESLVPATAVDADLHFYPAAAPLRAVVGTRRSEPRPIRRLDGTSLADAQAMLADAVAANPWTSGWPVVATDVVPTPAEPQWQLVDADQRAVPLIGASPKPTPLLGPERPRWRLLAASGGRPVTVAGELTHDGLLPLCVSASSGADHDGVVAL